MVSIICRALTLTAATRSSTKVPQPTRRGFEGRGICWACYGEGRVQVPQPTRLKGVVRQYPRGNPTRGSAPTIFGVTGSPMRAARFHVPRGSQRLDWAQHQNRRGCQLRGGNEVVSTRSGRCNRHCASPVATQGRLWMTSLPPHQAQFGVPAALMMRGMRHAGNGGGPAG